jgi:hypothetical protein
MHCLDEVAAAEDRAVRSLAGRRSTVSPVRALIVHLADATTLQEMTRGTTDANTGSFGRARNVLLGAIALLDAVSIGKAGQAARSCPPARLDRGLGPSTLASRRVASAKRSAAAKADGAVRGRRACSTAVAWQNLG